jgi:hypothetical protein
VVISRTTISVSRVMKSIDDELKVLGHCGVTEHERLKKLAAVIVNGSQDIAIEALIITTVTGEGSNIVEIEKGDEIKNRLEKYILHRRPIDEVQARLDKRRHINARLGKADETALPPLYRSPPVPRERKPALPRLIEKVMEKLVRHENLPIHVQQSVVAPVIIYNLSGRWMDGIVDLKSKNHVTHMPACRTGGPKTADLQQTFF